MRKALLVLAALSTWACHDDDTRIVAHVDCRRDRTPECCARLDNDEWVSVGPETKAGDEVRRNGHPECP